MGFKEVCKSIKDLKVQGAFNVAIAGVKAMNLKGFSAKKLLSLRPTEPMLRNSLKFARKNGTKKTFEYFANTKKKYIKYGVRKIPSKGIVFTHCHSSSVMAVLKAAKDSGKKFEVYNTETRPRFQGRKTSKELLKHKIKVTTFVDAAAMRALKKSKVMIIGADAILKNGDAVNKIGSEMFSHIAEELKVPVYIVTSAWKFSSRSVKIEQRDLKEVWKKAPKKLKIRNPAFEIIEAKHIKGIISELGILKPKKFVKKVRKKYKWI